MSVRIASKRDTALLGAACVAGVVVSPQFPYVGLPVAAAAAAGLAFRGRFVAGVVAALAGIGAVALIVPQAVAFAAPAAAVVLLAVWLLPRRSAQLTAVLLTVAIAASAIIADALSAHSMGQSLIGAVRTQAETMTKELVAALGSAGSAWSGQLSAARDALVTLWPSFYVQSAIFAAVLVIAAIAWAARRSGVAIEVPALRELDLSVHVLWLLVVGLISVAAAALVGWQADALRAVGLNALFIARTLFFLQGVAVFSALFDVPKSGYGKMVALCIFLFLIDQVLLIVSIAGLIDFWANFRRLPRDGSAKPAPLEDSPGEYLE